MLRADLMTEWLLRYLLADSTKTMLEANSAMVFIETGTFKIGGCDQIRKPAWSGKSARFSLVGLI
jgi:hypothetical protein